MASPAQESAEAAPHPKLAAAPHPKFRERLAALKNIPPVMKFIWDASPRMVVAELSLRIIAALIPLSMLAVTRVIIDGIYQHTAHQAPLAPTFWWMVALEFFLAVTAATLGRLVLFCDNMLAEKFMRHISIRLMTHASTLDLTTYEDPSFYDKLERARVQSIDRVQMIELGGRWIQEIVTTISLAAGIFLFSKVLLLALIVCVLPAFLGETHFAFRGYSLSFSQTPSRRELDYLRILGGSKEGVKELKLFGLAPFLISRYTDISGKLYEQTLALWKRRVLVGSLLALVVTAGYYSPYAYIIYETVAGAITLGMMTFLAGAIAGASTNIQAVFTTFSNIANQALFMTDLLEFFAVKPRITNVLHGLPAPKPIKTGFEFRNVSFNYAGSPRMVLNNVNFTIKPGERIALVGENGQGKTTIVKLMTRLYEPTSGQILLDGVDLREYDIESLWNEFGVIFQDFMRYEMTASENIAVGRIGDKDNNFRIRTAANKSTAEAAIRRLPKGFDQVLGSRFEGGVDLSGGEWQKIALARAYLRDAQVLVLDEPTAALDARAEHEVFQRFAELTQGKMALLISHRFATVKMADRILVLKDGVVAEDGNHESLMQVGGHYASMYELQAANYR
jgi:ATP-binding cassette, subfamily B, bacterial